MIHRVKTGTVYLVGAGPGDPGLITVKGLQLIRSADVLVYDRLVHPDLVDQAPAKAERIYAGKAPGQPSTPQEEINALLVDRGRKGIVVRLKGGDPLVFGRGSEEAQALAEAGIPFEIVPGISSALAAPAYAGIPLTHRACSRNFLVVTGHTVHETDDVEWRTMARVETLVILMGMRRLAYIAGQLIAFGRAPDTPAAVISQGTTAAQQTVLATLATIADAAGHLPAPATIVVGPVAAMHERIDWFGASNRLESSSSPGDAVFHDHIFAVSA
jgi:uroporphyrin-III C-methyltransferase